MCKCNLLYSENQTFFYKRFAENSLLLFIFTFAAHAIFICRCCVPQRTSAASATNGNVEHRQGSDRRMENLMSECVIDIQKERHTVERRWQKRYGIEVRRLHICHFTINEYNNVF